MIAVIGLGYVGLPLAVEFAKQFETIGFDIDDATSPGARARSRPHAGGPGRGAVAAPAVWPSRPTHPTSPRADVFIVTVPTPVDRHKRPDLRPLESASRTVGRAMRPGATVIYESTVYPGATEEVCVPILEAESGLTFNHDFTVGYSPERINPGDKERRVSSIVKVTSGSTPEAADVHRRALRTDHHRRHPPWPPRSGWPRPRRSSRTPSATSTSR